MEPDVIPSSSGGTDDDILFRSSLKILRVTDNVRELQTMLRDKSTTRGDFIFYADRLIRLVVEEGLNQLPYRECTITTPTGHVYSGLQYEKGNCGVSIMRSGEAMEQGLRDCCRSIRLGKILIQSNEDTHEARGVYAKVPFDIYRRKVLLMYPIMNTGNTVVKAVSVLQEHSVREENIILLNLFCTPQEDNKLQKKWIAKMKRENLHPKAHTVLCGMSNVSMQRLESIPAIDSQEPNITSDTRDQVHTQLRKS